MADNPRIEELKRRVQSDPASIAFAALAEEYRRAGRFDEAIEVCTAGLVRHPSYLSAHVTLGRALIEVGRFDDATEQLEYVLKLAPENLAAIRGLAEIHHRRGDEMHEHYTAADAARYAADAAAAASHADAAEAGFAARAVDALRPASPVPAGTAREDAASRPHPALAGLEAFLQSIMRARTQPPAAR